MIGSQDLMIALALGLILFGGKKLPELARGLGQSLKEFKKATNEAASETSAPTGSVLTLAAAPAPVCGACRTELQPGWSHCPSCGAAAAKASPRLVRQPVPSGRYTVMFGARCAVPGRTRGDLTDCAGHDAECGRASGGSEWPG